MRRRVVAAFALALVASGGVLVLRGGYMEAKAALADILIARAFDAYVRDGTLHRPWSWADHAPIAVLRVPRLDVERHVLTGASGSSLAFGVGHVDGTAPPNGAGNAVLAGHRDGAFAFLEDLQAGDRIELQAGPGGDRTWVVAATAVVADDDASVLLDTPEDRLTLVTCWPFRGLGRSGRRYVVELEPGTRS